MFDEENWIRDSVDALEERKLLQQIVSLGVGYHHGRSWNSKAAISNMNEVYRHIPKTLNSQENLDVCNIIREAQNHIRNGDDGYYLLDLHKGHMLAKGRYPIEDIIIDCTLLGTNDGVLLRRRKRACLHGTRFLIVPNAVYFLGMDEVFIRLNEFHMLSFIRVDGNSISGFVVDYDAAQNNRPLVLFPYKENNDIIQSQLDYDDHCSIEDYKSFTENANFGR